MAQKTLTAKVNFDTKSAEANLTRLSKKLANVQNLVNKTASKNRLTKEINKSVIAQERLNQATLKTQLYEERLTTQKQKTALAAQRLKDATDRSTISANKLSTAFNRGNSSANGLLTTVKRLASTYLGVMGTKLVFNTADTITSAQNRFNNLEGGSPEKTDAIMDKVYAAAQRSRSGYGDMLSNVSKSMTLAGDAFQGNVDNAIRFQEIMAKAYAVGGASNAEASSSMYQLVQALGAGVLQGDELKSVREGAPLAYKAIEKFAQGVFDTEESLKDLASQGVITSDIIVAALMDKDFTSNLEKQFENTQVTFAQTWENIKNTATKAFEPVLKKITKTLNSDAGKKAIDTIIKALVILADTVMWLFDILSKFFNWCAENWDWLKWVVVAALLTIVGVMIYQASVAVATAIANIMAMTPVQWAVIGIIAAVLTLVFIFLLWKQGAIDTCTAIALALLVVAIVCFFVFGWVVALVIAAIAIILLFFEYIAGGAMFLGALLLDCLIIIWNFFVMVIGLIASTVVAALSFLYNCVIGFLNGVVEAILAAAGPIISIVEWVLNVCNGGFDSFGDAVANLLGQIISWFLSLGKIVTSIIDAIFGTDWTDGLESLQDSVTSWGKNEKAVTLDAELPDIPRLNVGDNFNATQDFFAEGFAELVNPLDAYNTGYNWGSDVKDTINDWGSQFQDPTNLFDNMFNNSGISLPDVDGLANALGDAYDPSGANDDILAGLDELNGTTDDIKDSIDLTDDDLDYLRKIAEMEWRKEFTTAEIKVDMTNNNTVHGERDLDGIVSYLSDVLREEMTNVAYGVHY